MDDPLLVLAAVITRQHAAPPAIRFDSSRPVESYLEDSSHNHKQGPERRPARAQYLHSLCLKDMARLRFKLRCSGDILMPRAMFHSKISLIYSLTLAHPLFSPEHLSLGGEPSRIASAFLRVLLLCPLARPALRRRYLAAFLAPFSKR